MHRISTVLAGWIVRKPFAVAAAGLLLGLVSTWIIFSRSSFDSDILNLLPSDDPAVQGLKIFNSEFTQTRELAFLLDWPVPPSDLEPDRDAFLARLRGQPWMQRVLDAPPLETIGGRETIHEILVPLLLNLPPDQFAAALEALSPGWQRKRRPDLQRPVFNLKTIPWASRREPQSLSGRAFQFPKPSISPRRTARP